MNIFFTGARFPSLSVWVISVATATPLRVSRRFRLAIGRGDGVVTSDPQDLRDIADALGERVEISPI